MTYVPYIVGELPSNILLRVSHQGASGISRQLAWSPDHCPKPHAAHNAHALGGCNYTPVPPGLVRSYSGLLVARFFLGLLESDLLFYCQIHNDTVSDRGCRRCCPRSSPLPLVLLSASQNERPVGCDVPSYFYNLLTIVTAWPCSSHWLPCPAPFPASSPSVSSR